MNSRRHVNCIICNENKTSNYAFINNYNLVKCQNCALIYVNPQFSLGEWSEFYGNTKYFQRNSKEQVCGYRNYLGEQDALLKNFNWILDKIERLHPSKGRFLDIGCAHGLLIKLAKDRGWDASGVDVNPHVVEYARKELKLNVYEGTTSNCHFPDSSFDVVCIIGAIEHLLDPLEEVREVARILKRNGTLVILTPDVNSLIDRGSLLPPDHLYYFTCQTLVNMLKKVDFRHFRCETNFTIFSLEEFIFKVCDYTSRSCKSLKKAGVLINKLYKLLTLLRLNRLHITIPDGQMLVIAKMDAKH